MVLWLIELGGGTKRVFLVQIPQIHFSYQMFVDFLEKMFNLLVPLGSFVEALNKWGFLGGFFAFFKFHQFHWGS